MQCSNKECVYSFLVYCTRLGCYPLKILLKDVSVGMQVFFGRTVPTDVKIRFISTAKLDETKKCWTGVGNKAKQFSNIVEFCVCFSWSSQ